MTNFSNIDHYTAKKRGKTFLEKEQKLMADIDSLFDVYCEAAKQHCEREKSYGLKMTEKYLNLYLDQKAKKAKVLQLRGGSSVE